ncbi:MAG: enoyl-CoA hydratase-related protein [Kiloniellaceae bacterium]
MTVVSLELRGQIARVIIDNPPVNALGCDVRARLLEVCRSVEQDTSVKAVVLSCAGGSFVAGADIRELGKAPLQPYLPDVLAAIEGSRKPWVAAIAGTALGGGLELAMACHGRVAAVSARLGLPEVTLGMIPGSGGTVRLPRLVPMKAAVAMVTGGKPVAAEAASDMGLIDMLSDGDLLADAEALALELMAQEDPVPTLAREPVPGDPAGWSAEERRLAETDTQLAAVLAHEVGHVVVRHPSEQMSQSAAIRKALVAAGADEGVVGQLVQLATGVGALSFSRLAEAERIGLEYMARAGYDPRAAVELRQNMEQATAAGGRPPEILSTHPDPQSRIASIRNALPEVMPVYRAQRQRAASAGWHFAKRRFQRRRASALIILY